MGATVLSGMQYLTDTNVYRETFIGFADFADNNFWKFIV